MQERRTIGLGSSSSPTQVLGTPTTATSGRSPEFRKNSNPNPVEFVEDLIADGLLPTPNTMEHREIKTPEQIAELKKRSPGGYRNLRETVINELPAEGLLRTPSVVDSTGGAISETQAKERGRMLKVSDQVAELAFDNGLQVSESIAASLLPTPIASEGTKASAAQSSEERLKTGQVFLTNIIHDVAVENGLPVPPRLLPTPISSDSKGTGPADANRVTVQLRAINALLPTVTVQDGRGTGPSQLNRNTPPLNAILPEMQRLQTNWGKFEPAIRRWEEITRPAPSPTKPDGKDGNHRLSAEFTEWMMGLPAGWVTDHELGLKRNDQLKACGNGVVPQQAELALSILLDEEILKQIRK